MAHWAEIAPDGTVIRVTVGDNNSPDEGFSWLVENLGGMWAKCSYNTRAGEHPNGTPFRYNYPGPGWLFDADFGPDGAFIPPQPFPSWTLNPDTALWDAPTPYPPAGGMYRWDEGTLSWVEVTA